MLKTNRLTNSRNPGPIGPVEIGCPFLPNEKSTARLLQSASEATGNLMPSAWFEGLVNYRLKTCYAHSMEEQKAMILLNLAGFLGLRD